MRRGFGVLWGEGRMRTPMGRGFGVKVGGGHPWEGVLG